MTRDDWYKPTGNRNQLCSYKKNVTNHSSLVGRTRATTHEVILIHRINYRQNYYNSKYKDSQHSCPDRQFLGRSGPPVNTPVQSQFLGRSGPVNTRPARVGYYTSGYGKTHTNIGSTNKKSKGTFRYIRNRPDWSGRSRNKY
jgi:hypothetical protein